MTISRERRLQVEQALSNLQAIDGLLPLKRDLLNRIADEVFPYQSKLKQEISNAKATSADDINELISTILDGIASNRGERRKFRSVSRACRTMRR
jgi:hypothetical protein